MLNHIPHKVLLPNGIRATVMAQYDGHALTIVRVYLLMDSGEYRGVELPTDDPDALQVLDYIRSHDSRYSA